MARTLATALGAWIVGACLSACSPSASSANQEESSEEESSEEESSEEESSEEGALAVEPGLGVGPIALESTLGEAKAQLGEPDLLFVSDAVGFARYDELGLELVLSSPERASATDSSLIFAIGVKRSEGFVGRPAVGDTRAEVEAHFGPATDEIGDFLYFDEGTSVKLDAEGRVQEVGVFAPYVSAPEPPPMMHAAQGEQRA